MQVEKCFICPNIAKYKCPKCEKILFCDEDHGRLHIREDTGHCFPYKVENNNLVASRDIKPGEIILIQEPVVKSPLGVYR